MTLRAPAKLNLTLLLGPARTDGLHELRSLFCPLALADRLTVGPAEADEVVCPGVSGPNLAADALAGLRALGWAAPPLRIEIDKRVPVAAGLGGGSADAGAVLRLAADGPWPPVLPEELATLAARLGADVPSQLRPGPALVGGAGERVEALALRPTLGVVLIPDPRGLSTGEVYAEADRLRLGRGQDELDAAAAAMRAWAERPALPLDDPLLGVNDLEPAALSLRPELHDALDALSEAGADRTLVCGSGPTVAGLCTDLAAADHVAEALPPAYARAMVTVTESPDLRIPDAAR